MADEFKEVAKKAVAFVKHIENHREVKEAPTHTGIPL